MSGGEHSVLDPHAVSSNTVTLLQAISHCAGNSSVELPKPLPAEPHEESSKPEGPASLVPRPPSRPIVRPIRLNIPVPQHSPQSITGKVNQSIYSSKSPKSTPIQAGRFVYQEMPSVPHPATSETVVRPSTPREGQKHEKS